MEDRADKIAINTKYNWYQSWLGSMMYKFFDGSGASAYDELAQVLHKPMIQKFKSLCKV